MLIPYAYYAVSVLYLVVIMSVSKLIGLCVLEVVFMLIPVMKLLHINTLECRYCITLHTFFRKARCIENQ